MQTAEEQPEQSRQGYVRQNEEYHEVIAIENDAVLLLMLKEMYAQEGIHCDTCTDAAELIELIRKKEYSLLLTDLNMPDINGFELLELLRTSNVGNSKTIPVVVTTASGSCSKEELMERGFSGCLLKPFSISELMEVSDKCAMKGNRNEKPDFTSLLSYSKSRHAGEIDSGNRKGNAGGQGGGTMERPSGTGRPDTPHTTCAARGRYSVPTSR